MNKNSWIIVVLFFSLSCISFNSNILTNWKFVDFDQSMGQNSDFYDEFYINFFKDHGDALHPTIPMTNKEVMAFFKEIYINNGAKLKLKKQEGRIPKIIHQIWIGGPMPQRCKVLTQSWIKKHPDWECKLWTDDEVAAFVQTISSENRELINNAESYAEKADILRYEILYRFGGLYVDTDFECLKSMDTIHANYDFYTGLSQIDEDLLYAAIGIIGAMPGHPIIEYCVKNLKNSKSEDIVTKRTGPLFFTKAILQMLTRNIDMHTYEHVMLLPATYFYPVGAKARKLVLKPKVLSRYLGLFPEALACHYWHGTWLEDPLYHEK